VETALGVMQIDVCVDGAAVAGSATGATKVEAGGACATEDDVATVS
jgi:hypothetical protein